MHVDWDQTTQVDDLLYEPAVDAESRGPRGSVLEAPADPGSFHAGPHFCGATGRATRWRCPTWLRSLQRLPRPTCAQRCATWRRGSRPQWKRIKRQSPVWLFSTVVHTAMLLVLAWLTVMAQRSGATHLTALEPDTLMDPQRMDLLPVDMRSLPASSGPQAHSWDEASGASGGSLAGSTAKGPGGIQSVARWTGPVDDVRALFSRPGQALWETGEVTDGAEFFGVQAQGTRFVFVVDSSRSMAGRRWADACQELVQSVRRLGKDKLFYVIFFDDETHCMFDRAQPERRLLAPTSETIARLTQWMSSMQLGLGTEPCPAVQIALEFRPDAIFLLSDGEFQDQTATYLRRNNFVLRQGQLTATGVAVHTIGFHSRKGQHVLVRIARENHGRYRFISVHDAPELSRN